MGFRVRGYWSGPVRFPDCCPNCLQSPAVAAIAVTRSFSVPVVALPVAVGYEYRIDWPHCVDCSGFYLERQRIMSNTWIGALLMLAGTSIPACVLIFATGLKETWLPALMVGLWLPVLAWRDLHLRSRIRRIPSRRPRSTQGPAVRLIRTGRAVLSSENVVDVVFMNAAYVRAFVEANAGVARIKYPTARVERAAALQHTI